MTVNLERGASAATVAVLGAGSWGTTFAKIVADAATASGVEREIRLWGRRPEVVEQINTQHRNRQYLKDIALPESIRASTDVAEVLDGAELIILAVPAQTLRLQLREWKHLVRPGALVVSLMKGLELHTDARMSEVISEELEIPAEPGRRGLRSQPRHGNRPRRAHGVRGGLPGQGGGGLDRAQLHGAVLPPVHHQLT